MIIICPLELTDSSDVVIIDREATLIATGRTADPRNNVGVMYCSCMLTAYSNQLCLLDNNIVMFINNCVHSLKRSLYGICSVHYVE